MANNNNNSKISLRGVMSMDTSYESQPDGTYRYALNVTDEDESTELDKISTENSNSLVLKLLPPGHSILGKCNMPGGIVCIFSSNGLGEDRILTFNVNDNTSEILLEGDMGFNLNYPIDSTYRLRKGCEDNIYFTDNLNPPRVFNMAKKDRMYNPDGSVNLDLLRLQKFSSKIPMIRRVNVVEGGNLASGTYILSIQYLDEDMNPTEYLNSTGKINIYADKLSEDWHFIGGSKSQTTEYYQAMKTTKAIQVDLYNLDTNYKYYRVAILKHNSESGEITEVGLSDRIPISVTSYTYTGDNDLGSSVIEDIQTPEFMIGTAKNIDQIDNTLLLSNISGVPYNFCKFQKFASKIKAELYTKEVILNTNNPGQSKNPTVDLFSTGYQPGEIYAFDIVYILSNNTRTPAFHIPGRPYWDKDVRGTGNIHQMSRKKNTCQDVFYESMDTCEDYWGEDFTGESLEGRPVRHHRFPHRHEIQDDFVTKTDINGPVHSYTKKEITLLLKGKVPTTYDKPLLYFKLKYSESGQGKEESYSFNKDIEELATKGEYKTVLTELYGNVENPTIELVDSEGNPLSLPGLTPSLEVKEKEETLSTDIYKANIFGIKFSNIELPDLELPDGIKVIGYEIVRKIREDRDKTVVSTGILVPLMKHKKYIGAAHLHPNFKGKNDKVERKFVGLYTPEFMFEGKENTFTEIIRVGDYIQTKKEIFNSYTQDVQPGTSYEPDVNKRKEKDLDGFDLFIMNRVSTVKFLRKYAVDTITPKNFFYLEALSSVSVEGADSEIFNISSDNKIGIIDLGSDKTGISAVNLNPYVILTREIRNPYVDFRESPSIKQMLNPIMFSSKGSDSTVLFGGDSYICPLKLTNTFYVNTKLRKRATKSAIGKFLKATLGAIAAVAGVILSPLTGGASLALTTMGVQFMISNIAAGVNQIKLNRLYEDLWEKELDKTVLDTDTDIFFNYSPALASANNIPPNIKDLLEKVKFKRNPADDEIEWMSDTLQDVWFESSVNMNLRTEIQSMDIRYLPPVKKVTEEEMNKYVLEKITVLDSDKGGGRLYKGFATAEYYDVNKDYKVENKAKIYLPMPRDYDCCSDCRESFPYRIVYSQVSFEEEMTDNFRKFLPNNYKDLPGDSGPINHMFNLRGKLYLHTSEALYVQSRSSREIEENGVITFIGSGKWFELPAQKLREDNTGNTIGTIYKQSTLKFQDSYFFISTSGKPFLLTDGLQDLTMGGMRNFFKNDSFFSQGLTPDTPSSGGIGYHTTFDESKLRLILTKIDRGNSWTLTYSFKNKGWKSFMSYTPETYITLGNHFFSYLREEGTLWKHNTPNKFLSFYGVKNPLKVEFVFRGTGSHFAKTWENFNFTTDVYTFNSNGEKIYHKDITFSNFHAYTEISSTGVQEIIEKVPSKNILLERVKNDSSKANTTRVNEYWQVNKIRDIAMSTEKPLFINNQIIPINRNMYIEPKVLNINNINYQKDWKDTSPITSKFLAVQLTFNNFAKDYKLTCNTITEDTNISYR